MATCPFLTTLPPELRLQIYTPLLTYTHPIKLRQIIPGSRNLSLLRLNRQIHHEALSLLYDLNTIVVSRNDFCINTDASLKTPLNLAQARHLLIASFSQSIACTLRAPQGKCDVCRPSAMGMVRALAAMPRLRTVVVDYRRYRVEMEVFMARLAEEESGFVFHEMWTAEGLWGYRLKGPGFEEINLQFTCADDVTTILDERGWKAARGEI